MTVIKNFITYFTKHTVIRYIIAGGTSAVIDLAFLFMFNSLLGVNYLVSAVIAFLIAFLVSFTLHKYWTFKSHERETGKQAVLYMVTSLLSLGLNTLLMYIFVGHLHLLVLLSQIFAGALVACVSFFVSRSIVFKKSSPVFIP